MKTKVNQSPICLRSLVRRAEPLKKKPERILQGSNKPAAQHIARGKYFQRLTPSRHSINTCWWHGIKQIFMIDTTWELIAKPIWGTTWWSKANLNGPLWQQHHGLRTSWFRGWKAAEETVVKCGQHAGKGQIEFLWLNNFWNCSCSWDIKRCGNCFGVLARELVCFPSTSACAHG